MNDLDVLKHSAARLIPIRDYILGMTDGKRVIPMAIRAFPGGIDGTYDNYEATGVPAKPTPEIKVTLFRVLKKGDIKGLIESRGLLLKDMAFTDHQVIKMIEDHGGSLELDENSVFFLVKIKEEYYLHQVRNRRRGLTMISSADYHLQEVECEKGFGMFLVLPS